MLQFAIRDAQFVNSKLYEMHPEFEELRVKMNPKPLVIVEVRVRKNTVTSTQEQQVELRSGGDAGRRHLFKRERLFCYEVITKPSLEDVWTDFGSLVDLHISSVSRIKRIDEMVLP